MIIQEKMTWDGEVDRKLAHLATLGIDCVALDLPDPLPRDSRIDLSTPESAMAFFRKAQAMVAAHGMELRTVLATNGFYEIKKGGPGRDQKIAVLLNAVRAMGAAGVPILAYNFKLLNSKDLRSQPTKGRGNAHYISFDYDEYLKKPAAPVDPPVSEAQMWDNITYFLNAMIPPRNNQACAWPSIPTIHRSAGHSPSRRRRAHCVDLRSLPQDIQHRSFSIQRHAVLPGMCGRDEGRRPVRCHSRNGRDRQNRHGPRPECTRRVSQVSGDVRG